MSVACFYTQVSTNISLNCYQEPFHRSKVPRPQKQLLLLNTKSATKSEKYCQETIISEQ